MNKLALNQFIALLYREVLENRNLFIGAPAVLALLLFVFAAWFVSLTPGWELATGIEYLSVIFEGLSPTEMAPILMIPAIPFMMMLFFCGLIYLLNALYQDRKDMSVFFWQSMPVSNVKTVLSKVVTIAIVAPVFYVAVLFVVYVIALLSLTLFGIILDVQVAGLGYLFLGAVASLALVYLSAFVTSLWLLPSVGWLLLFSAFAKRTPILWAAGVFILIGFLEDFIFGSQYLANWVESRGNPSHYIIYHFSDVADRLFSYDMLFGVLVGSILLVGAICMRRFID
ncbi:MAG: hypothetical protein MI746_07095 [Pseudomonadales bacterium]|nr:hypothetical protein [Pseudomonadales bacterium]